MTNRARAFVIVGVALAILMMGHCASLLQRGAHHTQDGVEPNTTHTSGENK